ncbi:MAG: SBBP repeat-containing protein, partial [Candidatus Heimdallarchaeota archaeon]
ALTRTTSSASIPLVTPYQANSEGSLEIYVTLFSADGQSIVFSTYLGSGGWDTGRGIAFDSAGDLLVTGQIANAPIGTEGSFQQTFRGGTSDAFLAKFKTDGTLKYFTFLGGNSFDRANDLQVDSEDNIILTGYTNSGNFPTENPFQDFYVNYMDVFVTKINKTGTNVIFSTYMGGTSHDVGFAVAIDMDDNILITGETSSPAFPVYYDLGSPTGASDCLLAKFAKNGSLLFSTIFGGSSLDLGVGIAAYDHNSTVIVGFTLSNNLPDCNAYQDTYGGNCDLFVMKIQTMDLTIDPIVEEIPTPTPTPSPTETSGLSLLSFVFVALPALLFMFRKNSKKSLN